MPRLAQTHLLPLFTPGIAGSVAKSGHLVNIKDAYTDPRFDQSNDRKTGYAKSAISRGRVCRSAAHKPSFDLAGRYKTNTILTAPIKDAEGKLLGVIQAINKYHGSFTVQVSSYITCKLCLLI